MRSLQLRTAMSTIGQLLEQGFIVQEYGDADINVQYDDQDEKFSGKWNHIGFSKANFDEWKPKFDEKLKKLNMERREFYEKLLKRLNENTSPRKDRPSVERDKTVTESKIISPRNF